MILRKFFLLTFFLLTMAGLAFAEKFESGKVTALERSKNVIEIDGRQFHYPGGKMRHLHKGDKVKFIADYQYDDIKYRAAIIEIDPQ